ncbi:helix-turn-helix domain-containing protein [Acinetobacter sp. YH12027]|uniref:helix-turn-helix domain-containing protein n=1 Tax=Acinetobacter sp. YH12027 TaxID=2601043 RepID=UPI0015D2962F|nr:helix-turn-helix transcriptional regulator [Acinetobacter sp. YH12027]
MKYYVSKTSIHEVIGLVISQRRKFLGIPQGKFAQLLNLSNSALSKIESGQTALHIENLFLILSLLGLTLEQFHNILKISVELLQTKHKVYVYSPKDLKQNLENI